LGRIEEVDAERVGAEWRVTTFELGLDELRERLAPGPVARAVLGPLARQRRRQTVAWSDLDFGDPVRPRLRPSGAMRLSA
jgi:hypothetical protein